MKKIVIMLLMLVIVVSAGFFSYQGISMHMQVDDEEAAFHQLQSEYFSLAKTERDGAAANSELNDKLVKIQQTPSDLLRLKLVGVGKILTGIFILLFGILVALMMMPIRLAQEIKK
jgi:Tfp pilus assembly protein PilO